MALEGGEVNAGNVVHYLPVGLYSTTRAQQLQSRSTIPSYQFSRSHPSTRQLPPLPAWLFSPHQTCGLALAGALVPPSSSSSAPARRRTCAGHTRTAAGL